MFFLCRNRNELAQLIGTLENQIQNNDTKEESESEAGAFTFVKDWKGIHVYFSMKSIVTVFLIFHVQILFYIFKFILFDLNYNVITNGYFETRCCFFAAMTINRIKIKTQIFLNVKKYQTEAEQIWCLKCMLGMVIDTIDVDVHL